MSVPNSIAGAFARLHPGVQKQLWAMGWTELRPIQVSAIHALLDDEAPLILSAATASGKTEAAFLPALSAIAEEPLGGVRILYISPLKALINDQFRRVEVLCERLEIPVYRWHGDVAQSQKHKVLKEPGGILLITPESVESLFVNHAAELRKVLGGVRYIVVDELHAFLGNCRGQHLRSLLSRIQQARWASGRACLVGLSATLGDFTAAKQFFDWKEPGRVRVIDEPGSGREIRIKIHGYRDQELTPELVAALKEIDPELLKDNPAQFAMETDVLRHTADGAALVFANSKAVVELSADICTRLAARAGNPVDIRVHHGSLSAEIREDTEAVLKSGKPVITFCSSTLELGLDIGTVRMVGQIGPSWSVAAQRQRLGRSGRKEGEPSILRIYVECAPATDNRSLVARLQPSLIQSIAVTELMLEKWIEPSQLPREDYSTLAHQVMSVIAQTGGIKANELFRRLCTAGAFPEVESRRFAQLLRALGEHDVVEQMSEGDLILGLTGEAIRKSKDFYAVFPTAQEYELLHDGRSIGRLELVPEEGSMLIFAGKRWQVMGIDHERRVVNLAPARGASKPNFTGSFGEIHPEIRKRMRRLLGSSDVPAFLDQEAGQALAEARAAFHEAHLDQHVIAPKGDSAWLVFTWTGSRIHSTVGAILRKRGYAVEDYHIAWGVKQETAAHELLQLREARELLNPEELAAFIPRPGTLPKYFHLLGEDLQTRQMASDLIDLDGAMAWIQEHSESP